MIFVQFKIKQEIYISGGAVKPESRTKMMMVGADKAAATMYNVN